MLDTGGGACCYNRRYSEPGGGSGTPKWEMSGIRDDGICALQSAQDIGSDVNHDLYFVISNETSMIWRLPINVIRVIKHSNKTGDFVRLP